MDIILSNGQHSQSTLLCNIILEFQCSNGVRRWQQQGSRVVEGLVYDVILGIEWLNHLNPIIDWKSRTVQVQDLNIPGCEYGAQAAVEVCSWKGMVHTAKHTGNTMFLYTLNGTGNLPVAHRKCPAVHNLVVSAKFCATATSEFKEVAIPDPQMIQLCNELVDVFADLGMPPERDVMHDIVLQEGVQPSKPMVCRMSPAELQEVQRQLEEFLGKGWSRPSTSPYGAPIFFVRKADGSLRMYIDYEALNKQSTKDHYPIPRIDDLLDRLLTSRFFSKLDLAQGYHQVAITPGHKHKTALTSNYGLYKFTVLYIGLCNAPSIFYCMINNVFRDELDRFTLVYLDDILVYSPTIEEHVDHLRTVFEKLCGTKLQSKRKQCTFSVILVGYLGHIIGNGEV